jgi:hypothetical protein
MSDLTLPTGPSLKSIIESIDNRGDFKVFMQNYSYAHGGQIRGPRREGPQDEGFVRRWRFLGVFSKRPNLSIILASTIAQSCRTFPACINERC